MSDIEVDGYYQRQGKELVEMLFDKRFLNDDLSKESMDWLEDYLGFILQSQANSSAKVTKLIAKMRDSK